MKISSLIATIAITIPALTVGIIVPSTASAAVGTSTCGGPTALRVRIEKTVNATPKVISTKAVYDSNNKTLLKAKQSVAYANIEYTTATVKFNAASSTLSLATARYLAAQKTVNVQAQQTAAKDLQSAKVAYASAKSSYDGSLAKLKFLKTVSAARYVDTANARALWVGQINIAVARARALFVPCNEGGPYAPVLLNPPATVGGAKYYRYTGAPHSVGGAGHHGMDPYAWGVADISVPAGTYVYAHKGGVVSFAGATSGYYPGYVKIIGDDDSVQLYAHLDRFSVRSGQRVGAGAKLARVSALQQWPHLHLEWANTDSLIDHGCNGVMPWLAGPDDPGIGACL